MHRMMILRAIPLLLLGLVTAPNPRDPPPAEAAQFMTHLGIPQEMQTKIFHRSQAANDKYFSARPAALLRRAAAARATKQGGVAARSGAPSVARGRREEHVTCARDVMST